MPILMNESDRRRPGPESQIFSQIGLALALVGVTVWLILWWCCPFLEGQLFHWSWNLFDLWLSLLGAVSLIFLGLISLWEAAKMARDLLGGRVEVAGTVTEKSVSAQGSETGAVYYSHYIQVEGRTFSLDENTYNWVSEGEEVALTVWPRSEVVVEVRKLRAKIVPATLRSS